MTDAPTADDIARWRELDKKATKGPWESKKIKGREYCHIYGTGHGKKWPCGEIISTALFYEDNAALIAEYRAAVPRLLDRIKALEAEVEELKGGLVLATGIAKDLVDG